MLPAENSRSGIIIKNTLFLYLRMLVVLIIGLYTSRVILKALGENDFGILNLVGGIITLFVFVNQALSSATQRFITFDVGKGELTKLKTTFSTSLNIYFLFSIAFFILVESLGLYFLNARLNIEPARLNAANWVFQCMVITTIISLIRIPYNSLITAYEKMSFIAVTGIAESLLKLFIVIILVFSPYDKLKIYSILFLAVNVFFFFAYKIYCNIRYPEVTKYTLSWDKQTFKDSMKFSGLSLYEQAAVMFSYQGVEIILNMFFGVVVNAAMGITKQVQAAVFNFVSSFQSAMTPQITKSYAINDQIYLTKLMVIAPKFSLYLILILGIPVYFNLEPILTFWLDSPPPYTVGFCKLILMSSVFESVSFPLRTLIFAHGNITRYQLYIGTILFLNLILSYIFLLKGFHPDVVLWIRIIIYIVVDVFRVIYIKGLIGISVYKYIHKTFSPVILTFIISILLIFFIKFYINISVVFNIFISILILLITIYIVGISNDERNYLLKFAKQFITAG